MCEQKCQEDLSNTQVHSSTCLRRSSAIISNLRKKFDISSKCFITLSHRKRLEKINGISCNLFVILERGMKLSADWIIFYTRFSQLDLPVCMKRLPLWYLVHIPKKPLRHRKIYDQKDMKFEKDLFLVVTNYFPKGIWNIYLPSGRYEILLLHIKEPVLKSPASLWLTGLFAVSLPFFQ
jgi:hypothetical protein